MATLVATGIEKAYADRHILKGCDIHIKEQQRIGLIGVNGSGKSTLLSILSGKLDSDRGRVSITGTVAVLGQQPQFTGDTVQDVVEQSVAWHKKLLSDYQTALQSGTPDEISALQTELDHRGWEVDHRIDSILQRVKAPPRDAKMAKLSGGERRRVALAATLLQQADILLLDEPTNHLDADTVDWLESYLLGFRGGVLLVTHDRYMLEKVANGIVEIDQGYTVPYQGSYADYLVEKAARVARTANARQRALSMIAREAAWASRSPSARSTKQKARLQRLDSLREKVPTLDNREYSFDLSCGVAKGATLLEVTGLTKSYGERTLINNLRWTLRPTERWGIVGPNGAGKSTLLNLIRKLETPDSGDIAFGPRSKVGVLDQQRTGLHPNSTVFEAAGEGNDQVKVGDQWIHVAGFLQRFSFHRDHFEQPVSTLSGGEKARLLLAKLMLQGSTLLLLDEPTNDLDLLTLRVLEEALLGFDGAAIIVTHDRAFLDRVCTSLLAFEPEGQLTTYASRTQWRQAQAAARPVVEKKKKVIAKPVKKVQPGKKRLSYKEKKELEGLPAQIEALEAEQAKIEAVLADPNTYKDRTVDVVALNKELTSTEEAVMAALTRWEELEERA